MQKFRFPRWPASRSIRPISMTRIIFSSHVSLHPSFSDINVAGSRRKKGNPWSLGLDFRSSVTASLADWSSSSSMLFSPLRFYSHPDGSVTIESFPRIGLKEKRTPFVDSLFYGLAVFHPEDWLTNFYGMHPAHELSSRDKKLFILIKNFRFVYLNDRQIYLT